MSGTRPPHRPTPTGAPTEGASFVSSGGDIRGQQQQQQKRALLSTLLTTYTHPKPVTPHELVLKPNERRDGLCWSIPNNGSLSSSPCCWTEDITALALHGCPFDEYLGLRWYHVDPLLWIQRARQTIIKNSGKDATNSSQILFADYEFPVHEAVNLKVRPLKEEHSNVKSEDENCWVCIPGVITTSNCRDFATDPRRRRQRIPHFLLHADAGSDGKWKWARGSQMKADCSLFSTSFSGSTSNRSMSHHPSVDPRNLLQGKVGNCGFCAGFASIAAGFPHVVLNAFGTNSPICLSECGAVSLRLFPRGKPRYLLMDDYVLCQRDNNHETAAPSSPSMHSLVDNCLWVRLLEKAFVKLQGSYASLDGHYKYNSLYRHPARAMQLLTGAPVAIEVHYSTAVEDAEMVWDILANVTQDRCARVAHCRKRVHGLISNHGYSLLWAGTGVEKDDDRDKRVRLVCLRNPHGKRSYTGKYGFGRPLEELKRALFGRGTTKARVGNLKCFVLCEKTGRVVWQQHPRQDENGDGSHGCQAALELNDKDHDNGIFFMEFESFIEFFPIVTLVGPIRSSVENRAATVHMATLGANAANESAVVSTGNSNDVPDVVHVVQRENLSHVRTVFEAAAALR